MNCERAHKVFYNSTSNRFACVAVRMEWWNNENFFRQNWNSSETRQECDTLHVSTIVRGVKCRRIKTYKLTDKLKTVCAANIFAIIECTSLTMHVCQCVQVHVSLYSLRSNWIAFASAAFRGFVIHEGRVHKHIHYTIAYFSCLRCGESKRERERDVILFRPNVSSSTCTCNFSTYIANSVVGALVQNRLTPKYHSTHYSDRHRPNTHDLHIVCM